jgi:hypothetical protein
MQVMSQATSPPQFGHKHPPKMRGKEEEEKEPKFAGSFKKMTMDTFSRVSPAKR